MIATMSPDLPHDTGANDHLRVVLFSGGRGSDAFSRQLLATDRVDLTVVINGYDDGASTGDVRRLLGDCLGPSDFRKNASNLGRAVAGGDTPLLDLLDWRLPKDITPEVGRQLIVTLGVGTTVNSSWPPALADRWAHISGAARQALGERLSRFLDEERTRGGFPFADCALGNLVFAGSFLASNRRFNAAVDDYCSLANVPAGMVQNVTDGTNAFLVAIDDSSRFLASEADIVAAGRHHHVRYIFLIDHEVSAGERAALDGAPLDRIEAFTRRHAVVAPPNRVVLERIAAADLIVYAPGTQHSSLLPSYLTPGVGPAIASNLKAIKLLVTNLHEDADTPGASAVEIIERAVHYLKDRGRLSIRTPCLISHFLVNDGRGAETARPYVPLGRLEVLEDPRLVRVANYEDGLSGRHDANKVLAPFVSGLRSAPGGQRIVVWLVGTDSADKVCQTLLEAYRAGLPGLSQSLTALYHSSEHLDEALCERLPCAVKNVAVPGLDAASAFTLATRALAADYVLLCDSSGMYRGEDIVNIVSLLTNRRLDAVWGSRRLSVKDIRASYRERYRNHRWLGRVSFLGSHLLSLAYLLRYGRYVSDTLSGIRAVRTEFVLGAGGDSSDPGFNHRLLGQLLEVGADLLETPVQYFPVATEIERRTTVSQGLQALGRVISRRA